MRVFKYNLVVNGNMNASITSGSQQMVQMVIGSVFARFTGSPVGTLQLQVSNDNSNWTDYTGSNYSVTAAGSVAWNLGVIGYQYLRIVYTRTSGTGTLNVNIVGKGV